MDDQPSECSKKIELLEKTKAKKDRFRYGNYNRYYGTRTKGLEHDPRLDLLPSEWFRYRSVLDIGCNVGFLTLSIAKEYRPTRVLGIDIDTNLIGIARKNIRHYCDESEKLIGKFPASLVKNSDAQGLFFKELLLHMFYKIAFYINYMCYLLKSKNVDKKGKVSKFFVKITLLICW